MPTEIHMPPLPNHEQGRLARWFVSEGSRIATGDVIAEVETVTATLEIEASGDGRIERLLVRPGSDIVPCGTPLAIVGAIQAEPEAKTVAPPSRGEAPRARQTDASHADESRGDHRPAQQPGAARHVSGREAVRDALANALAADPATLLIGVEVAQNAGAEAVTQGLADAFGAERVVPVPPLAKAMAGLAIGAAFGGLKPILCLENWDSAGDVVSELGRTAAPAPQRSGGAIAAAVVVRGPVSGCAGAARTVAALAGIPRLKVAVPASPEAAYGLIGSALADGGPVALLEPLGLYDDNGIVGSGAGADWPLGRARIVREGRDATVIAYGAAVGRLESVLGRLAAQRGAGSPELIDLVSLRPLDLETVLASVARTGRLVAIDSGPEPDPILSEVVAAVAERGFTCLMAPPVRLSLSGPAGMEGAGEFESALLAVLERGR